MQKNFAVPYELAASEEVARFILNKSYFSKSQGKLKRPAFDPSPYDELSVVHSTGLLESDVWNIGRQTLVNQPGRNKIYGRADLPVEALVERQLRAIRDDNPFERHTSVKGWPESSDSDERKQRRIQICLELSQDPTVKLVIPESTIIFNA
ncbi:MAG: hypothetical protein WB424_17160 [Terracidiphilus sp.]